MRKNILIFKCIIVIEIKNKNLTIIKLNYKRKFIFQIWTDKIHSNPIIVTLCCRDFIDLGIVFSIKFL